jgi:hypothetical protein
MQAAINNFNECIARISDLHYTYIALTQVTEKALDISDILRSEIVLAVSAMDYFVHEITAIGMIEILSGKRKSTKAFKAFRVPVKDFSFLSCGSEEQVNWFREEIRDQHSWKSFQQSKAINDALRLITEEAFWEDIAKTMNKTTGELKSSIDVIVDRRNKIAHEADIDPSFPASRWPITELDVNHAINFIKEFCNSLYQTIKL